MVIAGAASVALTATATELLATLPAAFVTTTSYVPVSVASYVADVAPAIAVPSLCHWYDNPAPVASTSSVWLVPARIVAERGCVTMAGPSVTVTVAFALLIVPAGSVTTT
ncbi:hypothetical protein [Massilia orientalis]|uniref:Uncharacterized protein n=1 Tax=Massilia orientalis TaxID=3050128 RepID=A0ACC7MKP8_9BURK|nr:hypothetical protein [Massilia sp. YIM B02787]